MIPQVLRQPEDSRAGVADLRPRCDRSSLHETKAKPQQRRTGRGILVKTGG